jgi:hypothetical protein
MILMSSSFFLFLEKKKEAKKIQDKKMLPTALSDASRFFVLLRTPLFVCRSFIH